MRRNSGLAGAVPHRDAALVLQIIYVSSANPAVGPVDPAPILEVSRYCNQRDGITGLLYSDGGRFMQVIEGPDALTDATMDRIRRDQRHRAIVMLVHRQIEERAFGDWAMAHYTPGSDADAFIAQVGEMVANASDNIRATFEGFAGARRSALR
jgi:hypothetical protein